MITKEQLETANEMIKKIDFKGKGYALVASRISAFRSICPRGRIDTEILSMENGAVTMKTTIYDDDDRELSNGYAQEKEGSNYINKTSYIENCETSAIGRALGNLGIGSDENISSAEELANAVLNQDEKQDQKQKPKQNPKQEQKQEQKPKKPAIKKDTPEEAKANEKMRADVDKDLVPHGEGMTDERVAKLRAEIKRTGNSEEAMLKFYKIKDMHEMSESAYIACMNKLKTLKDKE